MTRNHLHRTLASVAVLLLSAAAGAQSSPSSAPAKTNAATAAQHAGDKAKGDDKPSVDAKDAKNGNAKTADPAAKDADHAARVKAQHDAEAAQLRAALHAPMTDAQRLELRHHAQRVAKLERIRQLAMDAKDTATVDKATKLLDKENARYGKWLATLGAPTDTTNGNSQAKAGAQ